LGLTDTSGVFDPSAAMAAVAMLKPNNASPAYLRIAYLSVQLELEL
jgi:hypothetical protein